VRCAFAGDCEARAEPHRLLERAGGGLALADDVEGGAVGGRGEDGRQAAGDRDAAVEALELGRDLPWSWYIESTPSNSPPKALRNTVSEGKGPLQAMPRAAAFATAGAITSISSRPKSPFSPPWGFSAHTAMRGFEARAAHGRVGERERRVDALAA
jgi:hypothetical protein